MQKNVGWTSVLTTKQLRTNLVSLANLDHSQAFVRMSYLAHGIAVKYKIRSEYEIAYITTVGL